MKKLLTFIAIITITTSCKKISNCYECTFGLINGHLPESQTYCGKNPEQHQFKDKDGNVLPIVNCKHQ